MLDEGRNVKNSGNEHAQFNLILTKENLMASNRYGIYAFLSMAENQKLTKTFFFLPHENSVMKS